ncbi:MAG TPA: benzoate/H(+) symporter BenE family transporter [Burkholderiaceae bacterium]|nr:benzoate/H(+) symporter BenE family transporter [Burkholderiaceae bacterium]
MSTPTARAPLVERPPADPPSASRVLADLGPTQAVNGLIGFVFAASGPVAIILSAGQRGGLDATQLASWIFGVFLVNGLMTVALSWRWRMPMVFFWTIPGTVLVAPALAHATHAEVVGAFLVTGALILAVGASGWVGRALAAAPMPIVMAMVAGVFLRFGLDLVRALHSDAAIAVPMAAAFLALTAWPRAGRLMPPILGALLVGVLAVAATGRFAWPEGAGLAIVPPRLYAPSFSVPVLLELVVPLAITVLVVQNGQGFAVLRAVGHDVPPNTVTIACGVGSIVATFFGAVSSCLTGPTNAIIASSGEKPRHYAGAVLCGALAIVFGLFASSFTALMLAAPAAFVATIAGLAMLRVLHAAFSTAFRERFPIGALTGFLVTVADQPILGVGAPFWGLAIGIAVSWAIERGDFGAGAAPR